MQSLRRLSNAAWKTALKCTCHVLVFCMPMDAEDIKETDAWQPGCEMASSLHTMHVACASAFRTGPDRLGLGWVSPMAAVGQFETVAVTCQIVGHHSMDGLVPAWGSIGIWAFGSRDVPTHRCRPGCRNLGRTL